MDSDEITNLIIREIKEALPSIDVKYEWSGKILQFDLTYRLREFIFDLKIPAPKKNGIAQEAYFEININSNENYKGPIRIPVSKKPIERLAEFIQAEIDKKT